MAAATRLNLQQRAKIDVLRSEKWSIRRIAKKIRRSTTVVFNYLHLGLKYGLKGNSGRKKIISNINRKKIISLASQKKMSARQIKAELLLDQSVRTVQRVLRSCPHLIYQKFMKKPRLNKDNKSSRLEFARNCIKKRIDWSKIIWSDEKRFNLDGPDGIHYYWHDLRTEPEYLSKRSFGGGSVMLWAAFEGNQLLQLYFMDSAYNSKDYTNMLEYSLLPYLNPDDVFMQDNASIHNSKHTNNWLKVNKVPQLKFPAHSPDLNPIENVWGILTRAVFANGRQFKKKEELKIAIQDAWNSILESTLENLIESMPDRIISVIAKNGGLIEY